MATDPGGKREMSELDIPLNTPEGQRLLGARDVIAEEAFRLPEPILCVTDPCEIPYTGALVVAGPLPVRDTSASNLIARSLRGVYLGEPFAGTRETGLTAGWQSPFVAQTPGKS
jgi:hypothetical protein